MPERGEVMQVQWPVDARVQTACSTRAGGVSRAPWDSLNLGDHVGDDPASVAANRQLWARQLGVRPVFLQQVHGCQVLALDAHPPDGLQADACVTRQAGVACTILVADCLPVLLADTRGQAVAAAHAGWRGLAGHQGRGVIEAVLEQLEPRHTVAWLGPCIGPDAFEVGGEVKAAFEAHDPGCAALFRPAGPGKWWAHLSGLARRRLQAQGVTRIFGNDGSPPWCTVANASQYFSFRRDGVCGRLAASIWLV